MSAKYILVEHSSAINATIRKIFQSTQRIKFTAFDVSTRYIILGVSSGGIYIFNRDTCEFVKLIPNAHGSPRLFSVSNDERYLAVAVSNGAIAIFEDCFDNSEFHQQVFREHENNDVTVMKWNEDDLYCGDSTGRVSVIAFKKFLKKTIFQAPAACLMQLDSSIVQLDSYSHFLLVSTHTRSLLCDTETERYKQIGKKNRVGDFGGCFLLEGIYCARPKARLWQADFQGNVLLTLDFRPSLEEKCCDVVYWDHNLDARLQLMSSSGENIQEFSFGKLFPLLNKFLLNYSDQEIHIFDPSSSTLICHTNHVANIKSVKNINEFMYIWHGDLEFTVLSLMTVEDLAMGTLLKRQYDLCADFCVAFFKDIIDAIESTPKIHYFKVLKTKIKDKDLLEKLEPIFQRLEEYSKTLNLDKIEHTIVTIHPAPLAAIIAEEKPNPREQPQAILLEQYKINKLHKNIQTGNFNKLMKSSTNTDIYTMISKFQEETGAESINWCAEIFLTYTKASEDWEPNILVYASNAFFILNESRDLSCTCKFPLPEAHKTKPKYYDFGCELMEKSPNPTDFIDKVPYMTRFILEKMDEISIAQLVQFSDLGLFELLANKLTYDLWDESVSLLLKLKNGGCLNCGKEIDVSDAINFTSLGMVMVRSIKPSNTIKLFKTYANKLPRDELDPFFYQFCIFMTVSPVDSPIFNAMFKTDSVKKQMNAALGKYLRGKYLHRVDFSNTEELPKNCDYCNIPLQKPIIKETATMSCGHTYHQMCLTFNANKCQICTLDLNFE